MHVRNRFRVWARVSAEFVGISVFLSQPDALTVRSVTVIFTWHTYIFVLIIVEITPRSMNWCPSCESRSKLDLEDKKANYRSRDVINTMCYATFNFCYIPWTLVRFFILSVFLNIFVFRFIKGLENAPFFAFCIFFEDHSKKCENK